jgi:hypothetical protein
MQDQITVVPYAVLKSTRSWVHDYEIVFNHWERVEKHLDGEEIRIRFVCGKKPAVVVEMS